MWTLNDYGEQERKKVIDSFQERLQEIRKMCGIKEDTCVEESYILNRKEIIWLMKSEIDDVLGDIEENGLESCFSQQEYDDIRELLEKLSSKLQAIDSTLENIFEQMILFTITTSYN